MEVRNENSTATLVIPKDFEGKIIERSWFSGDVITVIYFDETNGVLER